MGVGAAAGVDATLQRARHGDELDGHVGSRREEGRDLLREWTRDNVMLGLNSFTVG